MRYTAIYDESFLITYNRKSAFTSTSNDTSSAEWVYKGEYPIRTPTPGNLHNTANAAERIVFLHWGNNLTTQTIKSTSVTKAAVYNAVYSGTQYRIRFKYRNDNNENTFHEADQWLTKGTTPTVPAVPDKVYLSGETGRFVFTGWDKTVAAVSGAYDYTAQYDVEYRVRFFVGGKSEAAKTIYVPNKQTGFADGMTAAQRAHTTDTTVNFVAWRADTATGTPVYLTSQRIADKPRDYYAMYMLKTFTGSDYAYHTTMGSETPGIIVTREIKAVDLDSHQYKIIIEAYSYGKPLGYIDIVDSLEGNFYIAETQNIHVYRQKYLGNGVFSTDKEVATAGGGYGYVWHTGSDHTGYDEFDDGV